MKPWKQSNATHCILLWLLLLFYHSEVALVLDEGVVPVHPEPVEGAEPGVVHPVVLAAARLPLRTAVPRRVPLQTQG